MVTWSLTKELKTFSGKKTASSTNGAGSTGSQHVEECKLILYRIPTAVVNQTTFIYTWMYSNVKGPGLRG